MGHKRHGGHAKLLRHGHAKIRRHGGHTKILRHGGHTKLLSLEIHRVLRAQPMIQNQLI